MALALSSGAAAAPAAARHGSNHNHAAEHGLTLHDTLYADSRGAVHYRGSDDPKGDRRAVMGALREMQRQHSAGSEEGGSGGLAAGSDQGGTMARGRSPAAGRGRSMAAHAARERLQPRKFVRGAKAVKHTHMVNQPRPKAQA
jgi:hypothetical protein